MQFWQPAIIFLPKDGYFRWEIENDQTITLLSKKKHQNVPLHPPLGCSFKKFDKKTHAKVQQFRSTTEKLEQSFFIPKKVSKIVLLNTVKVVLTMLRVFFV